MFDSLKKRYFYKLFTNSIGVAIGFIAQLIIPRGLGPQRYGDFNFLTNFFTQLKGFCEMGTSVAFFTKLSHRPKESGILAFYFYFIVLAALSNLGFIITAHLTKVYNKLWPAQDLFYVYLAAILVIFIWIVQTMDQMNDAFGLTVSAEVIKISQKILGMILIIMLFFLNKLNLVVVFYYNFFILFVLLILFTCLIERNGYLSRFRWKLPLGDIKSYFREFYQYSHPLFIYALVGLVVGIFDRWLLQVFGGSIQQGFFSLSFQIGAICFLFSGAMTPLITREFSIAYANKDLSLMADLFRKHIPLLYAITAFLACFIVINADKVTVIMGGGKFKEAATAVGIMAFYPIHQTYGQLSNAVYFATGQTKLYRNIGIVFNLLGLPFVYFLIAPKQFYGINLGANGLAFKMVILNAIAVNVQLYFNTRFLKLPFLWYIKHQVYSVACFIMAALIANIGMGYFLGAQINVVMKLLLSGVFYFILVFFISYYMPGIYGLKKADIKSIINLIIKK